MSEPSEAPDLLAALKKLTEWASNADIQIHGEFGVGAYDEAAEIVTARAVIAKVEGR